MAFSHPTSPHSPTTALQRPLSTTATPLPSTLSASHFAAYQTFHRDLCRHAATLPRQLSDHFNHLQTLRTTSRTFSSHLSRLLTQPPSPSHTSVLQHFTGVCELLRVAVLQQLDTALSMLVECVATLGSNIDSFTRLTDSVRTAAMSVDVRLLTREVAAVREVEKSVVSSTAGSAVKATQGSGSHRKKRPDKRQSHKERAEAEEDDSSDPSLTAAVSPYTLLLTLEDIVYTLTALHQQYTAALTQLQSAVKGNGERSEERMREALDVLTDSTGVNGSMLEEWLSIVRRACKS